MVFLRTPKNMNLRPSHRTFVPFLTVAKASMLLLLLLLVTPSKAYGYADPGTGSFIYQAAYAAFLGVSFYLRRLLDRIWGKRK
jgi:hypothetical protein